MVLILILNVLYEGFPSRVQIIFLVFRLGLFYNEVFLDNVIQIHMKTKKWHLSSREAARHRHVCIFDLISKDTISRIKLCTALLQNLTRLG